MLERELEVVQLTKGKGNREKVMVEFPNEDMIIVSCKMENKFTSNQ